MTERTKQIINKLPSKKDNKLYSIMFGIILFIVIVIIIICVSVQKTYNSYNVIKTKARTDSMTKGYLYHNGNIIKYSNDGITVMGQDLKTVWSASYSMKDPNISVCEDYIAVADIGGKEVIVYDKKGNANKVENAREISQVEVSNSGKVAILCKENMAYYITVANSSKKYIDIKTRIKEDGYPLDMAFSPNSQKLVTSYMDVEEDSIENYVIFYNFSEVGKNYESKIVKVDSYGKVMVPSVEFLENDIVCVFSQEKFKMYEMKELPEEIFKTEKYSQTIRSVICKDEYVGLIIDKNDSNKKTIHLWNREGRKKLTKDIEYDYDKVQIIQEDIVLSTSQDAMIIRTNGKVKFEGEFKEEVEYILPYNNKDKFYLITQQNIDRVKLKNK